MSNSNFCDECGCYVPPGKEEVLISGGGFKIVCRRCYRCKSAAQAANTGQNKANRVILQGVGK